ncbi:MAG: hypothetical protein D3M94_12985 [Rhodocyclales bacterium GT-UBC]|nr:MAG: hypothetical protein D3M94_12985 [Rhodocyclales bacterium GT-UBC]
MRFFLLFLHLSGAIVWVGGMFFAHFCLRPVATAQLPPPQRLPLLAGVLGRFFAVVLFAIAAIFISGIASIHGAGLARLPLHWHLMMGLGLVMAIIFAVILGLFFPRLKAGVAEQNWPAAGAAMNRIRQLVATNLLLGICTVAIATLGSLFAA